MLRSCCVLHLPNIFRTHYRVYKPTVVIITKLLKMGSFSQTMALGYRETATGVYLSDIYLWRMQLHLIELEVVLRLTIYFGNFNTCVFDNTQKKWNFYTNVSITVHFCFKAELSLLLMDEKDDKQHFSLKGILDQEKNQQKKRKKKKQKTIDIVEDNFQVCTTLYYIHSTISA